MFVVAGTLYSTYKVSYNYIVDMEIELSIQMLGVLSSVVAMLFSSIPVLGLTTTRRSLVAIGVLIAGVFFEQGGNITSYQQFGSLFVEAALYAFLSYKMFLQPIVKPAADYVADNLTGSTRG